MGVRVVDDSFAEFYEGTRHRVGAFLYAMCGDSAEAQDAAQEAYVRAWQRWPAVGSYDDPEAWVRTVGYRLCINHWRRVKKRVHAYRRSGSDPAVDPPGEDRVALVAALRQLSPEERHAVVLHHLLDLPVTAVAAEAGVSPNTVKSRLVRGRRSLAALLGQDTSEEATHA